MPQTDNHTQDSSIEQQPHSDVFIQKIFRKEKERYQSKGYGLVFATLIALSFLFGVPYFAQLYWPSILAWAEEKGLDYFYTHLYIGTFLHNLCHGVGNLVYWTFYHFEFDFIERYKSNDLPWPWYSDREAWRTLCFKSIFVLLMNANFIIPVVLSFLAAVGLEEVHTMAVEDLPDAQTLFLSLLFFMLVEDFVFYMTHRLLHWRVIYPYIHKMHHSHASVVGIGAEYAHPIEFIFGNMLPTIVGPALLGYKCHLVTLLAWYVVRFTENLDAHSGYDFSWSPFRLIPLSGGADYHDFHHAANVGNYSSLFSIWDTVWNTNSAYYEAKAKAESSDNSPKVKSE